MRRSLCMFLALCLAVSMLGCSQGDSIVTSLGEYSNRKMYTHGGFQDYTDYGKYLFDAVTEDDLKAGPYFIQVSGQSEDVLSYIDNFESWVETIGNNAPEDPLVVNYDFDRTIVDESDYFCIRSKEGEPIGSGTYGKFDNYTLYFFDLDSGILYCFHNNI